MDKNPPLEIERKYLILYPDVEKMSRMDCYSHTNIWQTYINGHKNGMSGRVRKRGLGGIYKYTKTYKKDVTDVTRIEVEKEISETDYNELMKTKRNGYNTIEKTRHCFEYMGFHYEVDVYPFWKDRAIMECEVASESIMIPVPPCVRIIKEVTSDKSYRNSSLAQKIVTEKIIRK